MLTVNQHVQTRYNRWFPPPTVLRMHAVAAIMMAWISFYKLICGQTSSASRRISSSWHRNERQMSRGCTTGGVGVCFACFLKPDVELRQRWTLLKDFGETLRRHFLAVLRQLGGESWFCCNTVTSQQEGFSFEYQPEPFCMDFMEYSLFI